MSASVRVITPSLRATPSHAASPSQPVLVVGGFPLAARARTAFRGRAIVEHATTVRSAREILRRRAVYAVLIEPADLSGTSTEAFVAESRSQFPRAAVLACVTNRKEMAPGALSLVRAGARDVIAFDELELPYTVRLVVEAARLSCLADVIWPSIGPHLDPVLAPCVRLALRLAFRPLDVEHIARSLGIHRKTLWQRCQDRSLPAPRELLGWCRILAVAFALEDLGRSVDSIAIELEFPSPSAMRNLLQRYLRLTPTELRERGASAYATLQLAEALRGAQRK